jgi:hypothetical protein
VLGLPIDEPQPATPDAASPAPEAARADRPAIVPQLDKPVAQP